MKTVRDENALKEKSKGKTREGADEPLTMGDLQSHRKMFNLIKNTFPQIMVSFYFSLYIISGCSFFCYSPVQSIDLDLGWCHVF